MKLFQETLTSSGQSSYGEFKNQSAELCNLLELIKATTSITDESNYSPEEESFYYTEFPSSHMTNKPAHYCSFLCISHINEILIHVRNINLHLQTDTRLNAVQKMFLKEACQHIQLLVDTAVQEDFRPP